MKALAGFIVSVVLVNVGVFFYLALPLALTFWVIKLLAGEV